MFCSHPVGRKNILMKVQPLYDETFGTPWEIPDYRSVRYAHCYFVLSILGVEMRGRMVVIVHGDNDTKEPTDFRHESVWL